MGGVGQQPLPHRQRILPLDGRAAVGGAPQPVPPGQPFDPVDPGHDSGTARPADSSASRASMRRAASPPVSMLMLSSCSPGGSAATPSSSRFSAATSWRTTVRLLSYRNAETPVSPSAKSRATAQKSNVLVAVDGVIA